MVINMNVYLQDHLLFDILCYHDEGYKQCMIDILSLFLSLDLSLRSWQTDPEHVCACVWITVQTTGLQWVRGHRHTHTHTVNVNKKIVSSQKSNPLASQSHMCHLARVSQLVMQDKDQ